MVIAIVGATGVGKSDLSLRLAQALIREGRPAEIVNADAMQLYRGMNIGTAKLLPAQREGIPHHLIDVLDVTADASVAWYQEAARATILEIDARGATPIIVGGSGLYVSSILFDFSFPGRDHDVRTRLEAEMAAHGATHMFERLQTMAPSLARRIDANNERRVIRALEVLEISGDSTQLGTLPQTQSYWREVRLFGLSLERSALVQRLDARVEQMWQRGLVDEVRDLMPLGIERGVTARRAIGYAQALAQIAGTMTPSEAQEQTQALTRRYARRQVSWFARYQDLTWLPAEDSRNVQTILRGS